MDWKVDERCGQEIYLKVCKVYKREYSRVLVAIYKEDTYETCIDMTPAVSTISTIVTWMTTATAATTSQQQSISVF